MTEFSAEVIAAAQAAQAKWGVPAAISIAQYDLESANGTREPPGSNNPFGIKALPGQSSVTVPTHEFEGGRYVVVEAAFAKFASLADAFDHHGELLATSHYYAPAREAISTGLSVENVDAYANALTGVYATSPTYGAALVGIMQANGLYAYNGLPPPAPAPIPQAPTPLPLPPPSKPKQPVITQSTGAVAVGLGGVIAAGGAVVQVHNMQIDLTPILNPLITLAGLVLAGFASWAMAHIAAYAHVSMQSQQMQTVLGAIDRGISYGTSKATALAAQDGTVNVADTAADEAANYVITKLPGTLKSLGITQQGVADLILAKLPPFTPPAS